MPKRGYSYRGKSIKGEVLLMLEKKFKDDCNTLENMIRDQYISDIKEDMGGLTSSIHQLPIDNPNAPWSGGRIIVDVPYAKYVEDGRGPIRPKRKKVLSNQQTSALWGHSPFIASEAGPFEGHHSMRKAIEKFINIYG